MFTQFTILISIIVPLNFEVCFCQCARAEYETGNQCCPMCSPGNHVVWHCTDDTSTTCVPCPPFTFTDVPNGLSECFPCALCDANQGLRVRKACTLSSDTVCEPLERFYCIEKNKVSCILAEPHTQCRPGQYIKQAGTGSTDTVCVDCTGHTYSNGSFSSCFPHTQCEATGLVETNPGTPSSDTECGDSSTSSIITALSVIVFLIIILVIVVFIFWKKKKSKRPGMQQETDKALYKKVGKISRENTISSRLEEVHSE